MDAAKFESIKSVSRAEKSPDGFTLYTRDENATLQGLVRLADKQGFRLTSIRTESPNLDDVFLTLTGREIRE